MTTTHLKTDHQIQTAIVRQLDWSPDVESEHIGVAVTDRAVTLSGEVASLSEKDAAVRAALQIHCVAALVDDIEVRSGVGLVNDADIARAVDEALGLHVQLIDASITAVVHEQVVTLSGTVDWHFQREAARRAIETLPGVRDVIDGIAVRTVTTRDDTEAEILTALERGARDDAGRIEVSVVGHRATLRGPVHSWAERNRVEQAAWAARGVTDVVNNLNVV